LGKTFAKARKLINLNVANEQQATNSRVVGGIVVIWKCCR